MLVAYGIFRTSYVQTKLATVAANYLSKELGTRVSVGQLDISWFLDLVILDITVKDKQNNTLLHASRLKANIGKINFKRRFLSIYAVSLKDAEINLMRYKKTEEMNYDFIITYFSETDSATNDTTSSKPWTLGISGVKITNSTFSYSNQSKDPVTSGVDYNYLKLKDLNLEIKKISIAGDSITGKIERMKFDDKSGFRLNDLSTNFLIRSDSIVARDLHILTPGSHIRLQLKFSHPGYHAYNDFIDSVKMTGVFDQTSILISDIGYFAPELASVDEIIKVHGKVTGTVASLRARNFRFAYRENTYFEGNISMDGLPDINETFIHLNIKDLRTNHKDFEAFRINGKPIAVVPDELKNLGVIRIKGYFTGFFYDFVSAATFNTALGSLQTDLSLKTDTKENVSYNGHLNISNWNLGETVQATEYLDKIDFSSEISGSYNTKTGISASLNGLVRKFDLLGNTFNNIEIDGNLENRQFNGMLALKDELINLDFNGLIDFSTSLPEFNFKSSVKNAWLSKLNIWERDSSSCFSTDMDLNFKGSNIDNILGTLRFTNTHYNEKDIHYPLRSVVLTTRQLPDNTKQLSLDSDVAEINFKGQYAFADFYSSLLNILNNFLPSFRPVPTEQRKVSFEQRFEYTIKIREEIKDIAALFVPSLSINSPVYLFGSYNSSNNIVLINGQADQFELGGIVFNNWFINGQNNGNSLQFTTGSSAILFNEAVEENELELGIENFAFDLMMRGDSIRYDIKWQDNATGLRNSGKLGGILSFSDHMIIKSKLLSSTFTINDTIFNVRQNGDFVVDSTAILIDHLSVKGLNQELVITGKISDKPADTLYLQFKDLNVSNADLLLKQEGIDFDGILNGAISVNDLYNERKIQADITVKDLYFNKERLGDAFILTRWDNQKSGLELSADVIYKGNIGTHKPISARGYIYPVADTTGNFDLNIELVNYNLASLNPFLKGFASYLKGFTSGQLTLNGTFDKPDFEGELQLMRTQMKIDYLNVIYSFADKVEVRPNLIYTNNVMIYDSLGNTGLMTFKLHHDYFNNMVMDMNVQANSLSGLNTSLRQNELFYGTAVATGQVNIKGPFDDLKMTINAKSEKGTNIFIPINLDVQATENEFIKFISKESEDTQITMFEPVTSGASLEMLLDVTKDAGIQIFLPENIGNIKATGIGRMEMSIDTRGDITMFGDYNIDAGTFLFTFQNLINRVFSIERGSIISFTGSPYDADLNVKAVYKVRAALSGIPELSVFEEYAGRSIPVECIIHLKNNLYNPDIGFGIRLPDAEDDLKQRIYAAIDTTNDVVMTQQMVSLLLMKSFSFSGNANLAGSVGASSIEMLTSQLSGMLSQLSDDIDIGLNYRTGDAMTTEALEVALSTHLFDDRVTVEGNFGIANSGSTQNTNNIVGDVIVDVKITRDGRFRVKAYNKSNNPFEASLKNADYKQGIGVYYRYEFDRFSEIFRRQRKKAVPLTP